MRTASGRDRAWSDRFTDDELGLTLDLGAMRIEPRALLGAVDSNLDRAHREMAALERGATANPSEGRAVGHYWLRSPDLAPDAETRAAIVRAHERARAFAANVHAGCIRPEHGDRFTDILLVGIGGSSLGPRLVADALGDIQRDRVQPWFIDNTDPDGIYRVLGELGDRLASTLTVVTSKSGSTRETLNGLALVASAYRSRGLAFGHHAVAITGADSPLDRRAGREQWLERFPVWSWVGGRTSVTSPVGVLPAAVQGIDTEAFLAGASACDAVTRRTETGANPAALLALAWLSATEGRAARHMVVMPYKDRLQLLGSYLQQLVMESLGKKRDVDGQIVHQGLTVFGNKGSTDQHAYVQQLRDGPDDFFVTFIGVLQENSGWDPEIEPGVRVGDYLRAYLYGTRAALSDAGRRSMVVTIRRLDPFRLGVLIALFERAVGFYASLVRINAYDQPGVEAGKDAAQGFLARQQRLLDELESRDEPATADALARATGAPDAVETTFHVLEGLAATGRCRHLGGHSPDTAQFLRST